MQKTCSKFQYAQKRRHEHTSIISFCQCIVKGLGNKMWFRSMWRDITKQWTRHGHHQRGRYTLTRNIADTEEQLLVANIEIEQVSPHILSRQQHTIDIDVITLRIRREGLGQHRHLDVVSHLQLVLDSSLRCRSILEFLYVFRERMLHSFKGIA